MGGAKLGAAREGLGVAREKFVGGEEKIGRAHV